MIDRIVSSDLDKLKDQLEKEVLQLTRILVTDGAGFSAGAEVC